MQTQNLRQLKLFDDIKNKTNIGIDISKLYKT